MKQPIDRKAIGKRVRKRGNTYELKIIHELTDLGFKNLSSSRSASKALDNQKIDIYDPDNELDFYVQCKASKSTPNLEALNKEVGRKDKPLAVFWNKQGTMSKIKEFVCIPKSYFYKLISNNEMVEENEAEDKDVE